VAGFSDRDRPLSGATYARCRPKQTFNGRLFLPARITLLARDAGNSIEKENGRKKQLIAR